MKICFLSAASSYHTEKWCKFFSMRGHEVHLISYTPGESLYATVHQISCGMNDRYDSDARKLDYLKHGKELRKLLKEIKPDIVHAHRIPSYGGACAFAGVHKFILSVWGGDIYDFPNHSFLHKALVKFVLSKASLLMSTSRAMAEEIRKYTDKPIEITPFGVDMKVFSNDKRTRNDDDFVIGNIKSLEKDYGIDSFLKAAAIVKQSRPDINLKVRIAGKGSQAEALKSLADSLGLNDVVTWLGFISQDQAAVEWANMDVAVITSRSESFGVSAVEAQACNTPVIITDIPGLKEATVPGTTSIVVPKCDEAETAKQIIFMYDHPEIRKNMGADGRKFVEENYELDKCFTDIENIYSKYLHQ